MDMKSQNIKRISSVTYPSKLIICKMFTVVRKKKTWHLNLTVYIHSELKQLLYRVIFLVKITETFSYSNFGGIIRNR